MRLDSPATGEFGWHRLMTRDPNSAKAFYTSLFGWESYDVKWDTGTYTVFNLGAKKIAGLVKASEENGEIRSHWMSFITVASISTTVAKATSLGATLFSPIRTIETVGQVAVMLDPSNAYIGFFEAFSE